MAKASRKNSAQIKTRARTGTAFRPPRRKSGAPMFIAILAIVCGAIVVIKPDILDIIMSKKKVAQKKEVFTPVEIEDLSTDENALNDGDANRQDELAAEDERLRLLEAARRQKEIEALAAKNAAAKKEELSAEMSRTAITTMLDSFKVEIPNIKVVTADGDTIYGTVKTRKPLMIKTTLGNWSTLSEDDIESQRNLSGTDVRSEIEQHIATELRERSKSDSGALFELAQFCQVTDFNQPIAELVDEIATLDPKFGIEIQNQYAGKIYRDSLYRMAKGQKGLAKRGFREIPLKYPHSSYASDADHFANATKVDMDAMIAELQEKMGIAQKPTKKDFTAEDNAVIEKAEKKVAKTNETGKGDLFFKQAMKIYKQLDTRSANYKRKNAAALHLFSKASKEYQKALAKNPGDTRLEDKLQKATMMRYGCMKMSTL